MTDINLLRGRGKKKCLVLSKIVQQHRLSHPFILVVRLCIEYRWTLSRRGNISKVGCESFEEIISINCHFTTTSFKRVDSWLRLEISEPRFHPLSISTYTFYDHRSSDSIPSLVLSIHEYKSIVTSRAKSKNLEIE